SSPGTSGRNSRKQQAVSLNTRDVLRGAPPALPGEFPDDARCGLDDRGVVADAGRGAGLLALLRAHHRRRGSVPRESVRRALPAVGGGDAGLLAGAHPLEAAARSVLREAGTRPGEPDVRPDRGRHHPDRPGVRLGGRHAIEPGDVFLIAAAGLSFLLYVVLRTIRKKT